MQTFEAPLFIHDRFGLGAWCWVEMPFSVEAVFGKKGNVPVVAVVDGEQVRTTLMPAGGGRHLMMVNLDLQKKIRKRAGMTVRVSVEFDPEPRLVEMPIDFEDALENNPMAKRFFFDVLPPSHRKGLIQWMDEAKTMETRLKRIEKLTHACEFWQRRGERPKAGQSVMKLPE